jgi:Arc/MetJ family transcription regulator
VATNLLIDEALLSEAKKLGGFKTKRETVNSALQQFIQQRRQREILSLRGLIEFDPQYDYKAARRKR